MWLLTYRRQVKMHWTGRGFLLVHPVNATANLSHINVDGVIAAWVCAQFSCVSFVSVSVCAHNNCIGYQARSTIAISILTHDKNDPRRCKLSYSRRNVHSLEMQIGADFSYVFLQSMLRVPNSLLVYKIWNASLYLFKSYRACPEF